MEKAVFKAIARKVRKLLNRVALILEKAESNHAEQVGTQRQWLEFNKEMSKGFTTPEDIQRHKAKYFDED